MDKIKTSILVFAVILVSVFVFSTDISAVLYEWENITSLQSTKDMVDYNGEVWTATTGGLVRINPADNSYTIYTNEDGLETNELFCLHVDDQNRLWVGGKGRLLNFTDPQNPDGYLFTDRDDRFVDIYDIASVPGSDTLWLANQAGISVFLPGDELGDGLILDTYGRFGDIDRDTPARRVALDTDSVWIGSDGGFATGSRFDIRQLKAPAGWTSYTISDETSLTVDSINGMTLVRDTLYISGNFGTFRFNTSTAVYTDVGLPLSTYIYNSDSSGDSLLLYTSRGMYVYYNGALSLVPAEGMPIPNVFCGKLDNNEDVWIGNLIHGIFTNQGGGLAAFNTGGLPNPECRQIITSQGKIWGAFWYGGLASLERGVWSRVEGVVGLVNCLGVDALGALWVGTWGDGVYRILGDSIANFNETNSQLSGLSEASSYVVVGDIQSSDDAVWFANLRGQLGELVAVNPYNLTEWSRYLLTGGSGAEWVETITIGQGTVYIGSITGGIYARLYNGTPFNSSDDFTWRFTTANSNLGSDIIQQLAVDRYDSLWVGTSFGLSFQALGEVFFQNESLPDGFGPEVTAIAFDRQGNVYAGSNQGLVVRDVASGEFTYLNTRNSELVNDQIISLYLDETENLLWVTTVNGISKLGLPSQSSDEVDRVLAYPNPFIIRNGDETVRFTFAGLAEIRIFTLAGELVKELPVTGYWDGKNESGERVASGLYFFMVESADGEVGQGKIFLVRE